jgi:hypothetical protein
MMLFDDSDNFIPTYDVSDRENIIPLVAFIAKKIITLKNSFAISTDSDERIEILTAISFHQSSLIMLCISFFTEDKDITDLAKEIYRT